MSRIDGGGFLDPCSPGASSPDLVRPQSGALNAAPSMRRMNVGRATRCSQLRTPMEMRARFGGIGDGNGACEHKLWQLPSHR